MSKPHRKRRWFQFTLRTLLVAVTLSAIPCSWLAVKIQQAKRQRETATAIEKMGGKVGWDSKSSGPGWLRNLLGVDLFEQVEEVRFEPVRYYKKANDVDVKILKGLNHLQGLALWNDEITDAGLANLEGLSEIKALVLVGTAFTDAGLGHLKNLKKLDTLMLASNAQITDSGLQHLCGLSNLQDLTIVSAGVTDAGLESLKPLTKLKKLSIYSGTLSDAGIEKLQQALPNCVIETNLGKSFFETHLGKSFNIDMY